MKKPLHDIQESLQKAWSDALSSLHGVEEEVARRFRQLKDRADFQQGSDEVQRVLADLGRRLQESSEAMEQKLEESWKNVSGKLRGPLTDELARLRAKAEQLSRRIESQLRRRKDSDGTSDSDSDTPPL